MNMKVMDVPAAPPAQDPLDALFDAMFRPMNAQGVYARTGAYESVVEALAALISVKRDAETEVFRFPPVMSRAHLERHGYLKSFPNLLGCVSCLEGSEAEIRAAADLHATGGDWTTGLETADLVLTPAACYPVYPIAAARGPVPPGGYRFDVACDCFRREPSPHLDRLQSFRMREYVRIGTPEQVRDFRERWIARATALADELGLPYRIEQASDPFFGRVGQIMAFSQLEQSLKFELLVPLRGEAAGTACMSFNYHREHFGTTWDLRDASGEPAHTGCVAFGMDRLAVALFATHGRDVASWPEGVRAALRL
ncbi:amino acid--[acyl-carrier-protein] ligase [Methylobacterium oxalidis]|uniref:Amino acid--[acyl-carrier-protein] ligase 1 n=1 Tax=Methylobacterium oxalidis TaxID=944322 RepID=A0A512J0L5_9HYPH|nr:amino acid--[acyl-carrier-protein] ligase [Methylobacterium oxalidis]GEP03502.1 amino acid--[acyl-carrier-protein] ligase 1 [Methylobacterium oxalidis]GJE30086.1 Amino acid--[acyl-carrier-protein] ligase 1 [Methylobacterium oxalidis]GLS66578.1 amino acid--[acyl-carrier-protein] ligase 1 [Methylobacterium oxalidis]